MLVCVPFAWLWMWPSDLKDFSESLIAVFLFASNIFFLRESGYFDITSELRPLAHTWSLGVEEQYYLLFPLFLLLVWKWRKRWLIIILTVVSISSLALAEHSLAKNPMSAFYLLPTRAWELLIGVLVAFYLFNKPNINCFVGKTSQWGSLLGIAFIAYAVFVYDNQSLFPA